MQFNDNFPFITEFLVDSEMLNKLVRFYMHTVFPPSWWVQKRARCRTRHVKYLIDIELTFIETGLSNSWAYSLLCSFNVCAHSVCVCRFVITEVCNKSVF
jgi:hypothetical protein